MNWILLLQVIAFESIELGVFWLIASQIPLPLSHSIKFFIILVLDVLITEIVFPGTFDVLFQKIFNKKKN